MPNFMGESVRWSSTLPVETFIRTRSPRRPRNTDVPGQIMLDEEYERAEWARRPVTYEIRQRWTNDTPYDSARLGLGDYNYVMEVCIRAEDSDEEVCEIWHAAYHRLDAARTACRYHFVRATSIRGPYYVA